MSELFEFLAEFSVRLLIEGLGEWLGRRAARTFKEEQREQRRGLRLIYGSDRKLEDVVVLTGVHSGKSLSQLHLDIVMSLQSTWPQLIGRAAIARWLDRKTPGWRRKRRGNRGTVFIPDRPSR
jgi:hypothetical protein